MYVCKHILLVLINIIIYSWYTYKQHNIKRIQPVKLLQPTIIVTTKHKAPTSSEKRNTRNCPPIGAEETPSHEALTSRDSHQSRKVESSPIRNIVRRRPPSIFNTGSRASATLPFRYSDPPSFSGNTQSSPAHSKNNLSSLPWWDRNDGRPPKTWFNRVCLDTRKGQDLLIRLDKWVCHAITTLIKFMCISCGVNAGSELDQRMFGWP
jgi:hypothetical protein